MSCDHASWDIKLEGKDLHYDVLKYSSNMHPLCLCIHLSISNIHTNDVRKLGSMLINEHNKHGICRKIVLPPFQIIRRFGFSRYILLLCT
jgi:hypothetical protein